jgi:hypothetical protein
MAPRTNELADTDHAEENETDDQHADKHVESVTGDIEDHRGILATAGIR